MKHIHQVLFHIFDLAWNSQIASSPQCSRKQANMSPPPPAPGDHVSYMGLALSFAKKSLPKPSNFRVGAVLVHEPSNTILSTGYTLELPGNTHAEQCCLIKYATAQGVGEDQVGEVLPQGTVIYTTMEPCTKRLSGNISCAERILATKTAKGQGGIDVVYSGVREPDTFVQANESRSRLEQQGVQYVHIGGLEDDILETAKAGHQQRPHSS
jgi:pyrimidine deaminase RibD-like protein